MACHRDSYSLGGWLALALRRLGDGWHWHWRWHLGTAAETGTAALVLRRLVTYLVFGLVLELRTRGLALILVGDSTLRTGVV